MFLAAFLTSLILFLIPLTKLSIISLAHVLALSGKFFKKSTASFHFCLTFSTTFDTTDLIEFHTFSQAVLNWSLVFHNTIIADTSPAISVAINTKGFAFITMFKSLCATVKPSVDA